MINQYFCNPRLGQYVEILARYNRNEVCRTAGDPSTSICVRLQVRNADEFTGVVIQIPITSLLSSANENRSNI